MACARGHASGELQRLGAARLILSGLVAQAATQAFGMVAPFDVAILCLTGMTVLIVTTWPENYGDQQVPPSAAED